MLEWMLIIELLFLLAAGLFGLASMIIARSNERDPIYIWCSTFWRNFLWPPMVMELDSSRGPVTAAAESRDPGLPGTDDALYGRVKRDRDGRIITATLQLLVIPHAARDEVVGMEDGGLKIEVSGEAGDGRTNKSLIELISTAISVKPYQVTITKGHYNPRKTVQIQGLRPDELDERLSAMS